MHVDSTRNRNTSRLLAGVLALPLAVGALAVAPTVAAEAAEEPLSPAVSYDFDGDLADESGNQHDAEPRIAHDPAYAAGVNGQALLVTKGQNYVSLPVDVQPGTSGMTASFWYKQAEKSSDGSIFSNQNWRTGTNPGITLANQGANTNLYASFNGSRQYDLFDLAAGGLAALPGWNHITVVIDLDGQTQSVYRNGELVNSLPSGARTLDSGLPFRIGSDGSGDILTPYPNTWITGLFDDFAFHEVPLDAEQVRTGFRAVAPEGTIPEDGSVTVLAGANGSAKANVESADAGETITLTATPDAGYHLRTWEVMSPAGLTVTRNTFTMPSTGYVQVRPIFDPDLSVPEVPNGTSNQKVLVVGVDGLAWDQIHQFDTPNLDAIQAAGLAGTSYLYAPEYANTASWAGHASQLAGVWPDKSGVRNYTFEGQQFDTYPDFLTRLERLNPDLSTVATADWLELFSGGVLSDEIDARMPANPGGPYSGYPAGDEAETVAMQQLLSEQNPDAAYVYFGSPDDQGHSFGRESAQYRVAVERTDDRIGRLVEAVQTRPTYDDEEWVIMVAPDHGFVGHGHGGPELDERRVFVYAMGGGVPNQVIAERDPELVDIAATVIDHMGFPLDPALDGVPIGTPSDDPFDTLKSALQTAVDETGPGAGYAGWTNTAPTDWSIDNSAMGADGTTEWRGWSFATDVFWTGTNQYEDRENFVRGRDVWAVADPDAWAEKDHAGGFDSTLTSSSYDVTGGTTAAVSFMTQYRPADGQTASVSVAFDGGESTPMLDLTSAVTSERISAEVPVPVGATTMTVSWRLAAPTGGWFWAIDDPQVDVAKKPVIVSTHKNGIKPGAKLTVDEGSWAESAEFTYQWLSDGEPIDGATSEEFHLTGAWKNHDITVQVTGTADGSAPVMLESEAIRID